MIFNHHHIAKRTAVFLPAAWPQRVFTLNLFFHKIRSFLLKRYTKNMAWTYKLTPAKPYWCSVSCKMASLRSNCIKHTKSTKSWLLSPRSRAAHPVFVPISTLVVQALFWGQKGEPRQYEWALKGRYTLILHCVCLAAFLNDEIVLKWKSNTMSAFLLLFMRYMFSSCSLSGEIAWWFLNH